MRHIHFKNKSLKLAGTILYPSQKGKRPAILFIHGWTSERKRSFQYAKSLVRLGYICFLFDMRGHGDSQGNRDNSTHADFLNDASAAYDYLASLDRVDSSNITVVGSSMGGYIAAILLSRRPVKNVVLRVPADYPNASFNEARKFKNEMRIMKWRAQSRGSNATYALKALHNFKGQVLIIESEKDDRIPRQTIINYSRAIKNKTRLTHVVMKGAPHSMKEKKDKTKVEKIKLNWFKKLPQLSTRP